MEDYAPLIAELAKQGNEVAEFTSGDPVEFRAIVALKRAQSRNALLEAERVARLSVLDGWVDEIHSARAACDAALATMKQAARVEDNHRDKDFMWIVGQMRGILEASPLWKVNK